MNNRFSVKDYYCVYNDFDTSKRSKELHNLYLPLIGNDAISLYTFFGSKMLSDRNLSKSYLHYDILDNLGLSDNKFLIARKKLEALGLIQSLYFDNNGVGQFIYKIKEALSFEEFFNTPVLAKLLENTLGSSNYSELVNYYSLDKVSFKSFEDISAKFSDVFRLENLNDFSFDYITSKSVNGPNFDEYFFDFDKLNFYLANSYLTDVISNDEIKNKILGLAHIYKMSPEDMSSAIEKSVKISNGVSEINIKVLSDYIAQLNVNVRKQEIPTLDRMVNKNLASIKEEQLTEDERFAREVDNTNFVEYLNKQVGIVISKIDAKNIEELQSKYNFPTGVLNILLEYSIKQSGNNSVPHINYIDKIASTWSAQKLFGAKDAIDFVRANRNKKTKATSTNKSPQRTYSNNKKSNHAPFPEYLQNRKNNFNEMKTEEDRVVTKEDEDTFKDLMKVLYNKGDV